MSKNSPNGVPQSAKKVFSGVIYDIYQWPQKMFDESYEIFEKAVRPSLVHVIAVVGNRIIVLEEKQPRSKTWFVTIPGGRIDKGESSVQAGKRELLEETGYKSKNWQLIKEAPVKGSAISFSNYIYLAKDCYLADKQNLDNGEKIRIKLLSSTKFFHLADDDSFCHREPQLSILLLKARLNKKSQQEFRKLLFS